MTKQHRALLLAALVLLALAGLAWLTWGDYLRPHEPVRVLDSARGRPGPAVDTPMAEPAQPAGSAVPGVAAVESPGLTGPPAQPALAPLQPAAPQAAPASAVQDPLQTFRRAIEEAQARNAAQGNSAPATTPRYTSLPEAIEAARRAQLQASAPQRAPEPAPSAGINPFTR